jgi:hypothetical protein
MTSTFEGADPMETNCRWKEDDDGVWETACQHAFVFSDGSPAQNGFEFCPYCGGKLVIQNEPES